MNEEQQDASTHEYSHEDAEMRGALALPEPTTDDNDLVELPREGFAITDFKSASWFVTKLRHVRNYGAMIEAWYKAEKRKAQQAEAFFMNAYGHQLKELVQATTEGTDKKSLNLIGGKAQLRRKPLTLEVVDQEAHLDWVLDTLPDACEIETVVYHSRITHEQSDLLLAFLKDNGIQEKQVANNVIVQKAAVTNHFKTTGEIPPGCEVRGGEDELYVQ